MENLNRTCHKTHEKTNVKVRYFPEIEKYLYDFIVMQCDHTNLVARNDQLDTSAPPDRSVSADPSVPVETDPSVRSETDQSALTDLSVSSETDQSALADLSFHSETDPTKVSETPCSVEMGFIISVHSKPSDRQISR